MRCVACSADNTPGARFCQACGTPIGGAPEDERKHVTILFADIQGSTELIQGFDPEEARALLDGALRAMMDAVQAYRGTVNQVLGDGIMALFGAPLSDENHALRACYAALTMQSAIERYARDVQSQRDVAIRLRVGLNSGEVVVRAIRSDLQQAYSAVGEAVHLAARMEQLAQGGQILLAEQTFRQVRGYVRVRAMGPTLVKGFATPVDVFELVRLSQARTRLQALARRGYTRFVGRERELAVIHAALQRVRDGHGQVVALVGEPGIGKSRLVREIVQSDAATGFSVLECGAGAYGGSAAYRPVADLLHAYFRIQSRDDVDEIRARVAERLAALPPLSTPLAAAAVLALLDVPVDDATWLAMDPPHRRRATLDACIEIFVAESQQHPLLLVIEDLQGIDAESQALLDELAEHVESARVGMLVNYRPEYQRAWSADHHTLVRLAPLPDGAAAELLTSLLGNEPRLTPLKHVLMARTDGNPFFLEECVQALVESGALTGRRGQRRLLANLTELPIPATVQAILATRIDRLPPDAKRLLQSAAAIGTDVPFAILRAVADQPDDVLQRGLMQLQEAQILYEAGLFPELRYTFKHALTHDVAYGGMLRSRRVALHARVVDAIESLGVERLAEEVDVLAHHAVRGQLWSAAVRYSRLAGQKAAQASANRSAAARFEQALQALAELPAGQTCTELAIDLRLELGRALHPLGGQRESITFAREACQLAEDLGDARRLNAANGLAASSLFFLGEYTGSIEAAERTLLAAESLGDLSLQLRARNQLAQPMAAIGQFREAAAHHAWIVEKAQGFDFREHREHTSDPSIAARAYQAWCLAALGDEADAARIGQRAVALAEALGHPYTLTFTVMFVGDVYLILGDVARALPILERAWELTRIWDFGLLTPTCASWLGAAYVESGRSIDGLALLESAVPCRDHVQESRMYARLAHGQLHVGHLDAAEASALRALEIATRRTETPHQALALQLLGAIAERREPPDTAAATRAFAEALRHAEASQMTRVAEVCRQRLAALQPVA